MMDNEASVILNTQTNKDHFKAIVRDHIKRDGIDALMGWLETTDFYSAPASTRFHESYDGGLCEHSLNVYYHLVHLNRAYGYVCDDEAIAIVALFHDLCKISCYDKGFRNVKDDTGTWNKVPTFLWNEQNKFGFHGPKSMYIVMSFMKLDFNEASAISCHMGIENGSSGSIMDAFRGNILAFLLHMADMASTINECNEIVLGKRDDMPS